jgi:hypothetical protein
MKLFRPVGIKEYELIKETQFTKFPPRLEGQPIFYPVLNREYAIEIAEKWNTKDEVSGYCGFVTEFEVDDQYISNFEVKTVGSKSHQEYWIPAEELEDFNDNIIGNIKVIDEFYGEKYSGKKMDIKK